MQNASRLCFNASSNGNEPFNIMVASKARKSCHYSKSESFDAGENYMQIANEAVSLSPGKVRSSISQRRESIFEKRKVQSSSLEGKSTKKNAAETD